MSIVALSIDLSNSKDGVPEWVQILPEDSEFTAVDGREFIVHSPEGIIAASLRENVELYIDYEHSFQDTALEAKAAAGWIKALEVRKGAVWGRVEWTPKATQMIMNKEYRYLSPLLGFNFNTEGKYIVERIVNVALTNHPALEMNAFCNSKNTGDVQNLTALSQIASLMNIESCKPNDILTALKAKHGQEELQACKADVDSVLAQYVFPKCVEDEFLIMRRNLGKTQFQALSQKLSSNGFGHIQILNTPQTQALKARGISPKTNNSAHGLTESELKACEQTNVSPADYAKIKEKQHVN